MKKMPGKAYTMREMKQIVDYLAEHKLYNEIRGRKMWMDFANLRQIDRTWQSLKETFLKRILPDIQNPYYKLSVQQITSFRQGYDIEARNKSKLEINTVSDDSNDSSGKKNNVQPSSSKNNKEKQKSGEKSSKIQTCDRASTETLVLENCYETAEDILRDLEATNEDQSKENDSKKNEKTTLRDLITYSEPLTPMIQEVLHDFTTDDEDEPRMQIVEDNEFGPETQKETRTSISPGIRESPGLAAVTVVGRPEVNGEALKEKENKIKSLDSTKVKSLKLRKTRKGKWESKSGNSSDNMEKEINASENNNNASPTLVERNDNEKNINVARPDRKDAITEELLPNSEKNEKNTQNSSNTTSDTVLPNNQEAFDHSAEKRISNEGSTSEFQLSENKKDSLKEKPTRKRNTSQDNAGSKRKLRKDNALPVTEVEPAAEEKKEIVKKIEANNNENAKKDTGHNSVGVAESSTVKEQQETNEIPDSILNSGRKQSTFEESGSQEARHSKIAKERTNSSTINPCLKSVSLFAEQFGISQYSDSEMNDKEVRTIDKVNDQDNLKDIPKETKIKAQQKANIESEVNNSANTKVNDEEMKDNQRKGIAQKKTKDANENQETNQVILRDINEVVILKSHSESETDLFQPVVKKKIRNDGVMPKLRRDSAIANLFGFTSGATSRKRTCSYRDRTNRRYSQRKRTNSRHSHKVIDLSLNSGSSEYSTGESDTEELSPAHGNGHHNNRKYMKPKPFDIYTHPEGGLFTIHGKKMYPIVHRAGDNQYVVMSESDLEEESENYWKLKYLEESRKAAEEKIRADELARLLQRAKQKHEPNEAPVSPILQSKSSLNTSSDKNKPKQSDSTKVSDRQQTKAQDTNIVDVEAKVDSQQKTVKIKFNRNNEIELECQWPHVQPVLEQMAQMFHKNNEAKIEKKLDADSPVVLSSGKTTPADTETLEKVDKLEGQIFKEIEERDKTEIEPAKSDANVTKRKRGRPKSVLTSAPALSIEKATKTRKSSSVGDKAEVKDKIPEQNADESKIPEQNVDEGKIPEQNAEAETKAPSDGSKDETSVSKNYSRLNEVQSDTGITKRKTRTPKQFASDVIVTNETRKTRNSSRSTSKSSIRVNEVQIPEEDSQVLYKFPPRAPATRAASTAKSSGRTVQKSSKSYIKKRSTIISSPDNSSVNSIASSLGYQDSDVSLTNIGGGRKKKKLSVSTILYRGSRGRSLARRKSEPYLADDDTCEADPTANLPVNSVNVLNSSLNTEGFRSESYQLLFPRKRDFIRQLDEINETSAAPCEVNSPTRPIDTISPFTINVDNVEVTITNIKRYDHPGHEGNSSNVSLPLSPELSVVENISICKDMLSSVDEPTINGTQCNETSGQDTTDSNKYMISDIDISVPLMEQNCDLRKTRANKAMMNTPVSDSLINKVSDVNMKEQSSSDSLDLQLRNMLLESAKKIAQQMQSTDKQIDELNAMDVDTESKEQKKTRAKKRCSTPRKKRNTLKSKSANIEPVIEEHTQSCSRGGRKSCPPVMNIITCEHAASGDKDIDNSNVKKTFPRKEKTKKDVIKVKILRPREKSLPRDGQTKKTRSCSRMSVCTDSGINDTESGVFLQGCDDSVELIHNHSETCLHANECVADSVEFLENTPKSIVTVDSNSWSENGETNCNYKRYDIPETFCNDAQHATSLNAVTPKARDTDSKSDGCGTVYHSPKSSGDSFNSLITEDLSDNTPPSQRVLSNSKWYLLSEEETNTNFHDARSNDCASVGANLNQIFPITCAVPDLSTITEMSTENDSRKATLDMDVERSEKIPKSESIFDV